MFRLRSHSQPHDNRVYIYKLVYIYHAFALSSTERRRAKNMANQSKTQLSLLVIKQHELLLIAVAHKCMHLKTHNKRINHRGRSFVGHTLMDLVQLVAHYSLCFKYIYRTFQYYID